MEESQDLSKQIDFHNLTYHYKGKTASKLFIAFKGPPGFYKNIREGYITLEKAEEKQKEFKSYINEIVKGSKKSQDQKNVIKNTKTLYESPEKAIKLFDDYSRTVSEAKYKTEYGEDLKILTPKQMFQRLPIALAQVKAGNTSENLLNEIRQIIYSLYGAKQITKNVCNIMNSIKL